MTPGLLVISHGSRDAGWVALVEETVEAVRGRLGKELRVEAAYLELVEGRLIQDGLDRMVEAGVTDLLALPLFVSGGSTHVAEIGWALGAYLEPGTDTDLEPFRASPMRVDYGRPMGADPEILDIVRDRFAELSAEPSRESLLLIGHGSEEAGFRAAWERELGWIAERARERGGYRAASTALLLPDQAAERLGQLRLAEPECDALVLGLFLSEGYFTKSVIPGRLSSGGASSVSRDGADGADPAGYRYSGAALMPHPGVEAWIVRRATEWLRQER